jgi:hypothetical protein
MSAYLGLARSGENKNLCRLTKCLNEESDWTHSSWRHVGRHSR